MGGMWVVVGREVEGSWGEGVTAGDQATSPEEGGEEEGRRKVTKMSQNDGIQVGGNHSMKSRVGIG